MEFEVETVEYEVEYEEVEIEIPEIEIEEVEFQEDVEDFDFGGSVPSSNESFDEVFDEDEVPFAPNEVENFGGDLVPLNDDGFDEDEIPFAPNAATASGDISDEIVTENTLEVPEEPHFINVEGEDEELELPNAPVLYDDYTVTNSVDENPVSDEDFTEELEEDVSIDEIYEDPTLTEEQRAIIAEMQANGEYDDPLASELGEAHYWHDGPTMENTVEIEMNVNPNASYSEEELLSQMDMQEEGLNQMTVAEYLDNYENYQQNGRSSEGSEMQEQYREGLHASITYDLMEADPSLSLEDAQRLADEELKGGAALHNPDQVAGGDPTGIYAYGSGKANSAMGSMWGHGRAEDMHNQILEQTKGMTREEMENTHLNIRLKPNKGN